MPGVALQRKIAQSQKRSMTEVMTKAAIETLIPHRRTMLLLDRLCSVSAEAAQAEVDIHTEHVFFQADAGVPVWVGLEFMGQTAALIGGYSAAQHAQDSLAQAQPATEQDARMGYLAGVRKLQAYTDFFRPGTLLIDCTEQAVLGESLAKYSCKIANATNGELLAESVLTVVRKLVSSGERIE